MTSTQQILIIARREFIQRAKSRVFLGTMIVLGLLVIGAIFLVSIIGGDDSVTPLAVAGDSPPGLVADIEAAAASVDFPVSVAEYASEEEAQTAITDGTIDAVLVDGSTILSNQGTSATVTAIFTAAANSAVRRQIAAEEGLTAEQVAAIVVPVQMDVVELDPEDPDEIARGVAAFLTSLVLLTTIMMFGQFVAMGIVEEKQNRVVEVILSKVRTTSLLIGKVLGIGLLGLAQVVALAAAVIIGLTVVPLPDLGVPDLDSIGITAALWLLFWFVLGYLIYSFLYATLGATISRQEDMQSVAFIPAIAILPAYFFVSFAAGQGGDVPPLVRVASYVPLWSPIIMPLRINTGEATWWEVALAVIFAIVWIAATVAIGARVYRGAALRTGSKVSLREAWSSADQS